MLHFSNIFFTFYNFVGKFFKSINYNFVAYFELLFKEPSSLFQVVKMLIAIVVLFFVFLTPRPVWNLVEILLFEKGKIKLNNDMLRAMRSWVREWAFINSCVNAFVYAKSSR